MGSPNVNQGTLNRLRASVVVPAFPALNITASYLGPAGISIVFEGETTLLLPTMTGTVTSPAPYQMCTVDAALMRTQSLAAAWETQRQTLSTIGDLTLITDAMTMANYTVLNAAIMNVRQLSMAGTDAGYVISLRGYMQINANLWNL